MLLSSQLTTEFEDVRFIDICARDRTDGQNYDSQDRTSIAASRGKMVSRTSRTIIILADVG